MDENEVKAAIDAAIQPMKEILETMRSEIAGMRQPDPEKKDPEPDPELKTDPFVAWATNEKEKGE